MTPPWGLCDVQAIRGIPSPRIAFAAPLDAKSGAPTDGILTFTYEGFSASATDHMIFTFNDDELSSTRRLPWAVWLTRRFWRVNPISLVCTMTKPALRGPA